MAMVEVYASQAAKHSTLNKVLAALYIVISMPLFLIGGAIALFEDSGPVPLLNALLFLTPLLFFISGILGFAGFFETYPKKWVFWVPLLFPILVFALLSL